MQGLRVVRHIAASGGGAAQHEKSGGIENIGSEVLHIQHLCAGAIVGRGKGQGLGDLAGVSVDSPNQESKLHKRANRAKKAGPHDRGNNRPIVPKGRAGDTHRGGGQLT